VEHADSAVLDAFADTDEQPKAAPLSNEDMNEFDKLLETIRKVLGDQIKDARVSHRLADSPACLVSPDDGVTSSMERLMRVMQKDDSIPQKIFEINRDHPLLRTMLKLSKADPDDPQLAEMIQSLFDSTLLLDGYIKDPHALASRATKLLEQASAWYADVKKL
jgi:molecular chaperone HtpG